MCLYYANEDSDDVISSSTKTVQHSITNILGNIKAVFFKFGTIIILLYITKRNHCVVAMTAVIPLELF